MEDLRDFIVKTGRDFDGVNPDTVVFVCGNEAVDLDSTVCSFVLASVLQTWKGRRLIPFVNCDRSRHIIDMRGEVQSFFSALRLDYNDVHYLDDVMAFMIGSGKLMSVFLVDHNELSLNWRRQQYSSVKANVVGILDHHVDFGKFLDASPRVIEPTGSCSTLVLEYLHETLESGAPVLEIARRLLVKPLVLDTINFQRCTMKDLLWGTRILLEKNDCELAELQTHGKPIMAQLDSCLISDGSFPLKQVLFKDYKVFSFGAGELYGISTIRVDISVFVDKSGGPAGFTKVIFEFMDQEQLRLFCITVAVRNPVDNTFYQQIAIFTHSPDRIKMEGVIDSLKSHGAILKPIPVYAPEHIFAQLNPKISRKQIQPAIQAYLNTLP